MARHAAFETFGRSGNPVFGDKFNKSQGFVGSERMTLEGTVNKTGVLLGLCFFGAIISWNIPNPYLIFGGALVGFGLAIYTSFVPRNAGITAPIYAFVEGLFLGGISFMFEMEYPGIAIQAIGLTFGTLASLLFFYKSGLIKPTENFRLMIFSATFGIMILYLISIVMNFFGSGIGFIHSNGIFGIGFSLFVVSIAALNLVLDFDFIEQGSENSLPKFMEWYGLYGFILRFLGC